MTNNQEGDDDESKMTGSVDRGDDLRAKLKIPNSEGFGVEIADKIKIGIGVAGMNDDCSNNVAEKVCKICGKSFLSAKALGGHMRIHAQPISVSVSKKKLKPYDKSRVAFKKQGKATSPISGDDNTVCKVCFKSFSSPKAMYGHMRCHSDRTWRGANPPSTSWTDCSCSSQSDADQLETHNQIEDLPLTAFLPSGWVLKGIRGRKATGLRDDAEVRAASSLMMLGVFDGSLPKPLSSSKVEETKEPNKMGIVNGFSEVNISKTVLDIDLNEMPSSNEDEGRGGEAAAAAAAVRTHELGDRITMMHIH